MPEVESNLHVAESLRHARRVVNRPHLLGGALSHNPGERLDGDGQALSIIKSEMAGGALSRQRLSTSKIAPMQLAWGR